MDKFDIRSVLGKSPGDRYSDEIDAAPAGLPAVVVENTLDGEVARDELKRLLGWFYLEREKQAQNRLEMATDHDFYDNLQWDAEDAAILKDRGQMPLVYNEIAPMVDWLIGTERRTRVDWNVLPRCEDDVESAEVKKKVLKYVSDLNRVPFTRSRAFADAIKGGVGWVDDGARDDPTQDVLYSKYEDWRNVLWDSSGYELDLSDSRYVFRWRWVDEDIALMMFPARAAQIKRSVEDAGAFSTESEEDSWYFNEKLDNGRAGSVYASGASVLVDATRRRIRLIECQYRKPVLQKIVANGPMRGAFFDETDKAMAGALASQGAMLVDRVVMRVHFAVFTEAHMLSMAPSTYRHNSFSLTPIWCYRRSRDRLPYGVIRRVRDIQSDLNKRASKALFLLNTNQIIADEGAVDDWNKLRDEVDRPDGVIIKNKGKEIVIRRDTEAATGQLQMMTLDAQSIQKTGSVNNENLGRATNAVSGAAIEARQNQGAVGTTEPFDNLRLGVQIQGEKQLSLTEQFYTEEKVIRLTGAKGAIEWVKINQPEEQPDGSVRWLNDIASSMADFIVSEQDYSGTLRQAMFESLNQIACRLPAEVALRLLRMAFEFSDMPNKDEIVQAIRQITGEQDPSKELSPEEQQQAQEQLQAQAESMQMQREMAAVALEEVRARVREINGRAAKFESEAAGENQGAMTPEIEAQFQQLQRQAADQIDALSEKLRKVQADAAGKTLAINRDADTRVETARIDADAKVRVAEIQKASDTAISTLEKRMQSLIDGLEKKLEEKVAVVPEPAKPEPVEKTVAPAPAAPITLNVQIDAKAGTIKKTLTVDKDSDGNITGGTVTEEEK